MMLTLFNGLGEDNCKTRRETLKCWELVRLVSGFDGNVYNSHASANWTTRIHLDIATTTAAQQKYAYTFEMYYIHTPGSPRYMLSTGLLQYIIFLRNLSQIAISQKTLPPITPFSAIQLNSIFAESTAVQNFKMIWQMKWMLWMNEISRYFSWKWVSGRGRGICHYNSPSFPALLTP